MKHLDDAEFVDLLEGTLPSGRAGHAAECEACRDRVAELASTLSDVRADEAHEPSPLFWDHLAARVSNAIRAEESPRAGLRRWLRAPATAWAAAASLVMLLMVAAVWRTSQPAVREPAEPPSSASATKAGPAIAGLRVDDVESDGAWAVVRAAADEWRWEDAHAAGISARPGSAEGVALEMTADERAELARLLEAEMKQSGAS